MTRIAFAIPGDLATATGGYAYDRRVIAELRAKGDRIDLVALGDGFPDPDAIDRRAVRDAFAAIPDGTPTLIDGLALGVLPDEAEALAVRLPLFALVHHPLALESGLAAEVQSRLMTSERAALAAVRHVFVTSRMTARTLVEAFDVAGDRITVAEPGVDRPNTRTRAPSAGPVRLLSVGALVPRKGYDVLLTALAGLGDLDWTLRIVGDPDRSPGTSAALAAQRDALGLTDRVRFDGRLDDTDLAAAYRDADLFVLSSRYEGYGMVAAEALVHGLAMVTTDGGALAETVPDAAALKVAADDADALHAALRRAISDSMLRDRLTEGARAAATDLPTWRGCAMTIRAAIEDRMR